ncbi:hypothetical protein ID866_1512 [Astraeus odoratus]|nr:hypothetical protein ID866_1512 [Astraeus odoratus]
MMSPTPHPTQPEAGPSLLSMSHESPQAHEEWDDGLPSYGDHPTLLPGGFAIPSCLDRTSVFFQVLTAVYRPPSELPPWPRWSPPREHRDRCKAMVHFAPPPTSAEDVSPDNSPSTSTASAPNQLLYRPHGQWEWSTGLPIDNPRSLLSLRSGLMCSASIDTGTVAGKQIKYICRKWNTNRQKEWIGFHSELALYSSEQYLRPLQGDIVPTIIGVHIMPEAISVTMELPHSSFWIESSPTMPDVLKERVIAAFEKIHARGVLHGDPELRHMLIGADGRVTIIDFGMSRAITADESVDLEHAEPEEFLLEIRKVKYKLNYKDARKKEEEKVQDYLDRARRNRRRRMLWERRRNGEKTGYISPYESDPEDEIEEPPVYYQDFKEDWIKAVDDVPHRVVVPGQTETEIASQVQKFIEIVGNMAHEPVGDHDTLTTALTTAFVRSKRKLDDAFELPSTWPFPAKRARSDSPEPVQRCRYNTEQSDADRDGPSTPTGGDSSRGDRRKLKRVTFGGQSHRHIDAKTGHVVRCGERSKLTRQPSHPKCLRSGCTSEVQGGSSASVAQPQSGDALQRAAQESRNYAMHRDGVLRGILKRKRTDDPQEGYPPGRSVAGWSRPARDDTNSPPVWKKARTAHPPQSPQASRRAVPKRRRRRGSATNLAPDPFGFVLPAWRMFSTFVTSLIPWRR